MKKFLSLMLAMIMVMSLVTVGAGAAFTDAEEITQTEAVELLTGLGVLSGYADGSFKPEGAISRGAAAKIVTWLLIGTTKAQAMAAYGVDEVPFPDVRKDSSTAVFVEYCKEQGIIGGYSNGEFRPYADLTGHAFLKMVLVALGTKDIDFTAKGWQVDAVAAAEEMGLLEGIDTAKVNLGVALSRENACQIAMNALTYTPDGDTFYPVLVDGVVVKKCETEDDQLLWVAILGEKATIGAPQKDTTNSLGYKNWNLTQSTRMDVAGLVYKTWTNGEATTSKKYVEYAAVAPELKLTYTKAVKANDIAKDLGYDKEDYSDVKLNVTLNGIYNVANDVEELSGVGVETKVYESATKDTYTVIVTAPEVVVLKKADIVKADAEKKIKAHIKVGELTFETTAFKADDTVIVTYGQKNGKTIIADVAKAATVTGKVTATAADGSYIRVDGEKYAIAKNNIDKPVVGEDTYYKYDKNTSATYFLDAYNNIVAATAVKKDEVTEDAKYIYVYAGMTKLEADAVDGDNLFEEVKGSAAAQVKVIDLATGELSVKDLAVASKDGKWYLAGKDGKANTAEQITKTGAFDIVGVYTYVELEKGIVLTGEAKTTEIDTKKNTAKLADGLTATSTTTFTTVEIIYDVKDDTKITGATVKTVTGIANFGTNTDIDAIVTEEKGIVSNILYVTTAKPAETKVNYAIYKGEGEVGATRNYEFYVGGEVVSYTSKNVLDLKKGDVVALDLEDGKLTAAKELTAEYTGKISFIDDTFMIVDGEVIYFNKTVTVDAGDKYAVAELAEKDTVSVYTDKDGKAVFVVIAAED